jgi:hypothetical protein
LCKDVVKEFQWQAEAVKVRICSDIIKIFWKEDELLERIETSVLRTVFSSQTHIFVFTLYPECLCGPSNTLFSL